MTQNFKAASCPELIQEVAEHCVRLGRLGALVDHVETRAVPPELEVECTVYYRWANLDEPTHRRQIAAGGSA